MTCHINGFRKQFLGAVVVAGLLSSVRVEAGTHTWNGASSGLWNVSANWTGGVPVAGEAGPVILNFPSGATRFSTTNNISGLVVDQLNVTAANYSIHGTGVGTSITFSGSSNLNYVISGANTVLGPELSIALNSMVPFAVSNSCTIQSTLVGSGGFSLSGNGSLMLSNGVDNTFAGNASVLQGTLYLKSGSVFLGTFSPSIAIPGTLLVGNGNTNIAPVAQWLANSQVANTGTLSVFRGGIVYLNGLSNAVSSVILNSGGTISGASPTNLVTGTLGLNGNVSVSLTIPNPNVSVISANLSLQGAARTFSVADNAELDLSGTIVDGGGTAGGITKTGNGTLQIFGANTFTGATSVNAGTLWVRSNGALGNASSGTTVASGAQMILYGNVTIASEPLTLNGTGTATSSGALYGIGTNNWNGTVTLASDSSVNAPSVTDRIYLGGLVTGSGGLSKVGPGTLLLAGNNANTYSGSTYVYAGTLLLDCGFFSGVPLTFNPAPAVPGYLEIGASVGAVPAIVQFAANLQLTSTGTVKIDATGTLDLANHSGTCGPLTMDGGTINQGTNLLTLNGDVTVASTSGANSAILQNISLNGAIRQFNVAANTILELGAPASNGGVTKLGGGDLWLAQSNSYAGGTTINAGRVVISRPNTFSPGNGGIAVNAAGALDVYSSIDTETYQSLDVSNITLTLNGGTLMSDALPCNWYGPIVLAADSTFLNTNGTLNIYGNISGAGGVVVDTLKPTATAVTYLGSGDNTYEGTTVLTGGANLVLAKTSGGTAISGPLIVGNDSDPSGSTILTISQPNQILNTVPVSVFSSGAFEVNANDTIGSLSLEGAQVGGSGTLGLNGSLTNVGYAQIACNLSLNGANRLFDVRGELGIDGQISDGGAAAGITVKGQGYLELFASNTFSGPLVVDDSSIIFPYDPNSLGSSSGLVTLTNSALMSLQGVNISNKSLAIYSGTNGSGSFAGFGFNQTNTWSGPIMLGDLAEFSNGVNATNDLLILSGPISGPGAMFLDSSGTVRFTGSATNSYTGGLVVTGSGSSVVELAKTNNAPALGGPLQIEYGTVRLRYPNQFPANANVSFYYAPIYGGAGVLDLNGVFSTIGDLSDVHGAGTVNLNGATLTVGGTNPTNTFAGLLTGSGSIDKSGTNVLVLTGTNTLTGSTTVHGGKIFINGSQPSAFVFNGGMVGGTGRIVGALNVNAGGTVAPGYINPGTLTCNTMNFGGPGATVAVRLNGSNSYDQIKVLSSVGLGTGNSLVVSNTSLVPANTQFFIITNAGPNAITSTFNTSSPLVAGGASFQISYTAGAGANSVALSQSEATGAAQINSVAQYPNGSWFVSGAGIPGVTYSLQLSTNLSLPNWTTIGSVTAPFAGVLQFTETNNYPMAFYRFSYP